MSDHYPVISEKGALRRARRFIAKRYPEHRGDHIEACPDGDDGSWSFGVHVAPEDPRFEPGATNSYVGYVHANGDVEGLY